MNEIVEQLKDAIRRSARGDEVALAIMDECKKRLAEIGVSEVLIAAFSEGTGAGYSYNGNPKTSRILRLPRTLKSCSSRYNGHRR